MIVALLDHLWQSTLFCAAIGLIVLATRANGGALRHTLWLLASFKFLVPFAALQWLGAQLTFTHAPEAPPTLLMITQLIDAPVISPTRTLAAAGGPAAGVALVLVWLAGILWFMARWFKAWRAADSMVRAARPAPGSLPEVALTDTAIEPAAAGVLHPVVLLPSALLGRLTAPQFAAVLAHEREHIARRDNLTAHLHCLVQALFWFHPLVWWLGRRMVDAREQACDEAVLAAGHDAQCYAEGILAVCRHGSELAASGPIRGHSASAVSGNLTQRLRGILRHQPPVRPGLAKALLLAACTLGLALTLVVAGAANAAEQRRVRIARDAQALDGSRIRLKPALAADTGGASLEARDDAVVIRNTTLRELVAVAYGVDSVRLAANDLQIDAARYDVIVQPAAGRLDPARFDPQALRGVVSQLVATRFGFEIYVNQSCEQPCGRHAGSPGAR